MNKITLMGRLGSAPELKTVGNDMSVTSFNLAVDRGRKDASGNRITDWIPCTAWRGTAEFISKYFGKGDMIAVVGSLQSRKFTDKDGNNRTAYDVVIDEAFFCGSKNSGGNNGGSDYLSGGGNFVEITDDEEIPF